MATPQALTLLERARNGEKLSASERRHALGYLLLNEQMTNEEIAELFQVSRRQITYDKDKLKAEIAKSLKTEDVAMVIADLRLAFDRNMRDIEKGKAKAAAGTQTYLMYCKAAFQLQMDFIKGMQDLGIYPRELGSMHVEEFKFTASVSMDLSSGTRSVNMFDKREAPILEGAEVKELTDGGTQNMQEMQSAEVAQPISS